METTYKKLLNENYEIEMDMHPKILEIREFYKKETSEFNLNGSEHRALELKAIKSFVEICFYQRILQMKNPHTPVRDEGRKINVAFNEANEAKEQLRVQSHSDNIDDFKYYELDFGEQTARRKKRKVGF